MTHPVESLERGTPPGHPGPPSVSPNGSTPRSFSGFILKVFLSLAVASLVLFVFLLFQYLDSKKQSIQVARTNATLTTRNAAEALERMIQGIMPLGKSLAEEFGKNEVSHQDLLPRLRKILDQNNDVFGAGVAFAPHAYDPDIRLFAPEVYRSGTGVKYRQLEQEFDYTLQEHDWYTVSIANRSPTWTEPRFNAETGSMRALYSVPFFRTAGEPAGVVVLQIQFDRVRQLVSSLDLGKTGYGFILSKKGNFLTHPVDKYVQTGLSLFDLADQNRDDTLRTVGARAITGNSGFEEHINPLTGQTTWMFFDPIPSTGWSMVVVFVRERLAANTQVLRQQEIWIAMSAIAVLSFLSVLLTRAYQGGQRRIWLVTLTVSALFLAGIGFIWHLTIRDPVNQVKRTVTIVDRAGLDNFLLSMEKSTDTALSSPQFVPTGIFVQSMEFANANNTIMTGYAWQRFTKGSQDHIERGFIFPELSSADDMEIQEQVRQEKNGTEHITWFFRVVLRQRFDYSHYPFDKANIWVRLWPRDFKHNVMLIPDLEAYTMINPTALPGLEGDLFLPGWTFEQSYFDYKYNTFNTNFGKAAYHGQEDRPELYFNIVARRNFLGPFISNLIPLIVVAFMLFGLLIIGTKQSDKSGWLNFNAQDILASCAALVFVVILAHIDLRGTLAAEGILYLEYFYFVMYVATLLVSINAILFSWDINLSLIRYQDNLVPKLVFWPMITGSLLIITLIIFY